VGWPPHPEDEYVEVTPFGSAERHYMLARSGAAQAIADARAEYVAGRISVEVLEQRIHEALHQ
jgi:hypothetical protein